MRWLMQLFRRRPTIPEILTVPPPPRAPGPDPALMQQQQMQADYIARLRRMGYDVDVAARRITPLDEREMH